MPDAVVVGGGVNGASIAYHLAARGLDVELRERAGLASGPTGRSTAIIREHYSQPLLVRMASYGRRAYTSFREEVGSSARFERVGLLVSAAPADAEAIERNVELGRSLGVATELVDADALREIDPRIEHGGLVWCWEPEAGVCDPYAATAGYAAAARRLGARIETGRPVAALSELDADVVVVAAGPWSAALLEPVGYELPLVVARAEVGRYRLPLGETAPPSVADFSALSFYVRPAADGVVEVGSLDPGHVDRPVDPDTCPDHAEPGTLDGYARALEERAPALAGGHWRGSWSGLYDVTPDWHPAVGPVADGVYVAAGFSGHGFKLAPAVGVSLAELIVDGAASTFDLAPLSPGRFARDELLGAQYGYSVLA
jgi:glycine/D-amino acid oxidase-like deaminating enzyme